MVFWQKVVLLSLSPSLSSLLPSYPFFSCLVLPVGLSRLSSPLLTNTCTPKVDAPWTAEALPAIPTTTTAATSTVTATATSTLTALLALHRSPGVACCCSLFFGGSKTAARFHQHDFAVHLPAPLPPHSTSYTVSPGTRIVVHSFALLM